MRVFSSILVLTFVFFQFMSKAQTTYHMLGTWKLVSYTMYEHDVLMKEEKSDYNRKIYINGDGTIEYAYVHYIGYFNHGLFPHTSKHPVVNRWALKDSIIHIYPEHPKKLPKGVEEKPINKIVVNKITTDTLILIFTDVNVRCFNRYLRVKN